MRTAKLVADAPAQLGLEVRTGIAHTGVVGVLRGGQPGPVIALRADMDALPVTEQADLPFKSRRDGRVIAARRSASCTPAVTTAHGDPDGRRPQVLAAMREQLPGTVMFVFQPAEEGAPDGERGGARLMLEEGLFDEREPEAMFGLHLRAKLNVGEVGYRRGPIMAGSDRFRIVVTGRSDARRAALAAASTRSSPRRRSCSGCRRSSRGRRTSRARPSWCTVGAIKGGVRNNIIPDTVELVGTMRTFDPEMRRETLERIERIATQIAAAAGATATVEPDDEPNAGGQRPGADRAHAPDAAARGGRGRARRAAVLDDRGGLFVHSDEVPTLYVFVGITAAAATQPRRRATTRPCSMDENSLDIGLRSMLGLALEYLYGGGG